MADFSLQLPDDFLPPKKQFSPTEYDLDPEEEPQEFQALEKMFVRLFRMLDEPEKVRIFMEALKIPKSPRKKDIFSELAHVSNRSEKELYALSDSEKARIFARRLHKINSKIVSRMLAATLASTGFPAIIRYLQEAARDVANAGEIFKRHSQALPTSLWGLSFGLHEKTASLTEDEKAAIKAATSELPGRSIINLPVGVGEMPQISELETFLLDLHAKTPSEAVRLIRSLVQINPTRAESWLLVGFAGLEDIPGDDHASAWSLAGRLLRWGSNLETADKPYNLGDIQQSRTVVASIFTDTSLAKIRAAVGEYLLRQLEQSEEFSLLVDVLPDDIFRELHEFLEPIVQKEAERRASEQKIESVRALIERFPFLKNASIVAIALRRAGHFDAAITELRQHRNSPESEEALSRAKIANAFATEIPETTEKQAELIKQLSPIAEMNDYETPEIVYCRTLRWLMEGNRDYALESYHFLSDTEPNSTRTKAYALLAALQSQDACLISEAVEGLEKGDDEAFIAIIPANLLRSAIRSLVLLNDTTVVEGLSAVIYRHSPEVLDPLLTNDDLLRACPTLLQRTLDKTDDAGDVIEKWAAYQKVLGMAINLKAPALQARAVDSSLSLDEPLLAPYQTKLLIAQIATCPDLDLKELLIDKLVIWQPDSAKPFLHQLLQTYRGNNRAEDSLRIADTLAELGDDSPVLQQTFQSLRPASQIPAKKGNGNGKLPHAVSVCFYGGDECEGAKTEQLRRELIQKHPGLSLVFDHSVWNSGNLTPILTSVAKYDVIVASNMMRTQINHGLRQRARELGKTFGFCRNRGMGTISKSIVDSIHSHFGHK